MEGLIPAIYRVDISTGRRFIATTNNHPGPDFNHAAGIAVVPPLVPAFDFNSDGFVDVVDVDLLVSQIAAGENDATFDLSKTNDMTFGRKTIAGSANNKLFC